MNTNNSVTRTACVTVTDTFAGEANYSWIRRYYIPYTDTDSDVAIVRRAKLAARIVMACDATPTIMEI